jgi:hypothetical protein
MEQGFTFGIGLMLAPIVLFVCALVTAALYAAVPHALSFARRAVPGVLAVANVAFWCGAVALCAGCAFALISMLNDI